MTMNVNPVGATPLDGATGVDPDNFRSRMQQALAPVAQLFNETPDQLMNDLRSSNSSLSQLAQAKGVSQDDLVAAIKQGLQSSSTGTSPLSDTQLTNIASRIANHKHGGHHHHHGGGASTTNPTQSVPGADPSQLDVQRLLQDLQNVRQFDQSL